MKMISEHQIEQAAEILHSSEKNYELVVEEMRQSQPVLLSYFFSESFRAFTPNEQEFLLYLLLVIWKAISLSGEELGMVNEQQLSQAEDDNWEKLQGTKAKGFHERLNIFFHRYPQEDLLAFVEDALAEEEEDALVTKEGREAMFVALKTVIDCLTGNGQAKGT